jgi:putative ABC transport system permease protein
VNDHRAVIVGIAKVATSGLYGTPTLYTTYERAVQYIPNPRYTISYVLVEPKSANDIPEIKRQVEVLGYRARTKESSGRELRTSSYTRREAEPTS